MWAGFGWGPLAGCGKVRKPLRGQAQDHVAFCCELRAHSRDGLGMDYSIMYDGMEITAAVRWALGCAGKKTRRAVVRECRCHGRAWPATNPNLKLYLFTCPKSSACLSCPSDVAFLVSLTLSCDCCKFYHRFQAQTKAQTPIWETIQKVLPLRTIPVPSSISRRSARQFSPTPYNTHRS